MVAARIVDRTPPPARRHPVAVRKPVGRITKITKNQNPAQMTIRPMIIAQSGPSSSVDRSKRVFGEDMMCPRIAVWVPRSLQLIKAEDSGPLLYRFICKSSAAIRGGS